MKDNKQARNTQAAESERRTVRGVSRERNRAPYWRSGTSDGG